MQDFTRTTTEQVTIHNGHKMNSTVYTQSDTTHRCRGAKFSVWVQGTTLAYPALLNGGEGEIRGVGVGSEFFFVFLM